jgi:hypothetical protein
LILIFSTKKILILISVFILFLSLVPLFKINDIDDKPVRRKKKFLSDWKTVKDYIALGLYGIHSGIEGIVWPMFIFVIYGTIESVAILPIIVSITTIVFTFFSSKMKLKDRSKYIAIGSALIALIWLSRLFIDNTLFYYTSVIFIGFFSIIILLPLDNNILENGNKHDPLSAATYRNFFSMLFRTFIYIFLICLTEIFDMSFLSASLSMFVIVIISMLFNKKKLAK